jgi:endonuclease-3
MAKPVKKIIRARKSAKKKLLDPASVVEIFERLKKENPSPRTELVYTNPYTLLVAVTLSAQMTDIGVNRATGKLFEKADTPQKMLKLGETKLRDYIKTINFNNNKAKNIIAQAKVLVENFGGDVPQDHDDLVSLPGVGNKTANVVRNEIFGHHTIAVDTHIFRVSQRLGLAYGSTPDEIERGLLKIIPKKYQGSAHHWILLHGRYICKARTPLCFKCPLVDLCLYPDKNLR